MATDKYPFLDPAFGGCTLRGFQGKTCKITEEETHAIRLEEESPTAVRASGS